MTISREDAFIRTLWTNLAGADFDHRMGALSEGICPQCRGRLRPLATPPRTVASLAWCDVDGCWFWDETRVEWTTPDTPGVGTVV